MEIGPLKDDRLFTEQSVEPKEKSKEPPEPEAKTDSVEISAESAQRLSTANPTVDLAKYQSRIESGYYDSPEVRERVIDKLTDELLENIRQFYK